ncbi:MAG: serine--tRNA ligase [Alphaproteobacteria bacterium]|nr:serine--tRNA ligase [Alphaproteobacteria bacterium]
MLDMKSIRQNPEYFKKLVALRRINLNVDDLLKIDEGYRQLLSLLEQERAIANKYAAERNIETAKQQKPKLAQLELEVTKKAQELKNLSNMIPNTLAEDVPVGKDDTENIEIYKYGDTTPKDFKILSHDELGTKLGILDIEKGTKIAGRGFFYWLNDGLRLKNAVFAFTENLLANRGFEIMGTPLLTNEHALYITGYHPFIMDQEYNVKNWDLTLIGTSEQTIVSYHAGDVLNADRLPLLYTAQTPCFRSESGAAGKANRGIFRVHQFYKQEQIVFCRPEDSEKMHLFCQRNIEDIMKSLEIPFRVVNVCVGDIAAPGYKKYDTEAWFPSQQTYKETHSNSNLSDFQARRANIKIKDNGEKYFAHTISSTAITERAVIALMENNQTREGHIRIPKALQPFMGNQDVIVPHKRNSVHIEDSFDDLRERIQLQKYRSFKEYMK